MCSWARLRLQTSWEHLVGTARAHVMSFELLIVSGQVSDFPIGSGNVHFYSGGLLSIMRVGGYSAIVGMSVHLILAVVRHPGVQAEHMFATHCPR